jgi:cytochrome c oxidase cbb3-type subunit 3
MSNKTIDQQSEVDILKGEESLVLDHNYDGIKELDHMLPRWWVWLFAATVIFGAWYAGYYMSGVGPTPQQELALKMVELEALNPKPSGGEVDDAKFIAAFAAAAGKPEHIKNGQEVYASKCLACHGDLGQGVIGPNLTDDYWIHGKGRPEDIARVVADGVSDKGMPPWSALLSPEESVDVVVFIDSIHDSHPDGAKAPQGEKYEE